MNAPVEPFTQNVLSEGPHAFKKFEPMPYDMYATMSMDEDEMMEPMPPNRPYTSIISRLTVDIIETFRNINPNFRYDLKYNPRRVLTKPSEGVYNHGFDNKEHEYIIHVKDYIGSNLAPQKYEVLDLLGKGTFGQVVKCLDHENNEYVAVKIVKNQPAFYNQGMVEVSILKELNTQYQSDRTCMVQMIEHFVFRGHLCLVFELLSISLFDLIKQNNFKGVSLKLISLFMKQILTCLTSLYDSHIIHCDLKPENILLVCVTSAKLRVIDFGSACYENHNVYTYIQSRFYRSPEVMLGHQYKRAIDIWSLGCIAFELFVGLPLFPGQNQHRMFMRFMRFLGDAPYHMLRDGRDTSKFFNRVGNAGTSADFVLKPDEEYYRGKKSPPSFRDYFKYNTIERIVMEYKTRDTETDSTKRRCFLHFINQMLRWDPEERWTPRELMKHPFITGDPFHGTFERPTIIEDQPMIPHGQTLKYWPFVGTPTDPSYMQGSGFMSPLGTSPNTYFGPQYFSPNNSFLRNQMSSKGQNYLSPPQHGNNGGHGYGSLGSYMMYNQSTGQPQNTHMRQKQYGSPMYSNNNSQQYYVQEDTFYFDSKEGNLSMQPMDMNKRNHP